MDDRKRARFRRRPDRPIVAVRLSLDMDVLEYRKWGHVQQAHRGDWIVNNDGDVYTVAADSFASTYRPVDASGQPGLFVKTTPVWAFQASEPGVLDTKEGHTAYAAGDFIVSNQADGSDSYAIARDRFHELYEPA